MAIDTKARFVKLTVPSRHDGKLVRTLIRFDVTSDGDISENMCQKLTRNLAQPYLDWLSENSDKSKFYGYATSVGYVICFYDDQLAVLAKLTWPNLG